MAEIKIEVKGYKCERCGHEWIPRKKEYPILCPNCKSAYWDKPVKKRRINFFGLNNSRLRYNAINRKIYK